MNKFMVGLVVMMGVAQATEQQKVTGSLYAVVHSSKICCKVFCGGNSYTTVHHFPLCILRRNTVLFYDNNNQLLAQEPFVAGTSIKDIQKRLDQKPKAVRAEGYSFKAPGWQGVDLFDAHNNCIARTNLGCRGLREGSLLDMKTLEELKEYVSNPEDLNTMRITHRGDETYKALPGGKLLRKLK